MTTSPDGRLDVDTLMTRVRADVARRKYAAQGAGAEVGVYEAERPAQPAVPLSPLPLPQLPKPQFKQAERYALNDFLALHDADFIRAAYKGILQRDPDASGTANFLSLLRNGRLSKIEILGRLRYSPEGRHKRVRVRGLLPAFAVQQSYRVPVLGQLTAFAMAVIRLPRITRILQHLEGYQYQRNSELEAAIGNLALAAQNNDWQLRMEIDDKAMTSSRSVSFLEAHLKASEDAWSDTLAAMSKGQEAICHQLEQLDQVVGHLQDDRSHLRTRSEALDHRMILVEARDNALEARAARSDGRHDDHDRRIAAAEGRADALEGHATRSDARHDAHEIRLLHIESQKQEIQTQLVAVIRLAQDTSAQIAASVRETLGLLEARVERMGSEARTSLTNSQSSHLRLLERIARVEGRVHEQTLRARPLAVDLSQSKSGPAALPTSAPSRFDRLYWAFEQRFRGSREDILKRLDYYLLLLRSSVVVTEGATVLDIGCGRGEWLELLQTQNIAARGVDLNEGMVQDCIQRGLNVVIGDAIALLKELPDNALGALTGFHIIEHISLETLLELIEEASRVVQPGGLIIFETPNPENVIVGSCSFYTDPTHRRPLPPVLTQFLVESGGFADVTIHYVNADLLPKVFEEAAETDPRALRVALDFLRSAFMCAPDYSIVGRVT
jgi:SAM-dependent methyltransferase